MKRRLLILLPAALLVLSIGASGASATVTVEWGDGNPVCDGFKVDPVESGRYWDGDAWFDVNVYQTPNGPAFDWASNLVVTNVTVKGGPMYNEYMYDPGVHFDNSGLHAPVNPNNKHGYWYGLSHLCFEGAKKTG